MAKIEPKKRIRNLKIKDDPTASESRHRGKRVTRERPPAPRVPPKRRER